MQEGHSTTEASFGVSNGRAGDLIPHIEIIEIIEII